jgi:hypothetical protein
MIPTMMMNLFFHQMKKMMIMIERNWIMNKNLFGIKEIKKMMMIKILEGLELQRIHQEFAKTTEKYSTKIRRKIIIMIIKRKEI